MAKIDIKNLSFGYDSNNIVFSNLNVTLDSSWRIGLIGRNGRGKSTLLKLLAGKIKGSGTITGAKNFYYFPLEIDPSKSLVDLISQQNIEDWKIYKELNLLDFNLSLLNNQYGLLSGGEKVKFQFAIMFADSFSFALIDEPTNHLDEATKEVILNYIKSKKGYIIVSHDRYFLDNCIDHVLSFNKTSIELIKGNYSSWEENFKRQQNYNIAYNERLEKDIDRLEESKKKIVNWSLSAEKAKFGGVDNKSGLRPDRGYVGSKAARVMKRAKTIEKRINDKIEDKKDLLKDVEKDEHLKVLPNKRFKNSLLIMLKNLSKNIGERELFKGLDLEVYSGDRVAILGDNGCGKTTLLKILLGQDDNYNGSLYRKPNLKISYISQETEFLKGDINSFIEENKIDKTVFFMLLDKLNIKIKDIKNLDKLSDGQKKKILIAKSLSEQADIYIWDEPLNFIDIISRLQIEELIEESDLTLIFVQHDKYFIDKIATKVLQL